jgi:cation diffusion facilitator family transporter
MSEAIGEASLPRADEQRDRRIRRVLVIEGLANLSVLVVKTVVGIATGSSAVLADAVHSFADLANNGLALFALHLAAAPPDREHPYGHRKYETLAVFALATLLAVLAVEITLRAFQSGDRDVLRPGWSLGVMLGVLVVNVAVSTWEGAWARRLDSDLLRADTRHTFSDVLVTIVVIVGWQLAAMGRAWLDTAFTLAVAALILFLAFGLYRRAIPVLVDRIAADPERLAAVVQSVPGVRGTRRVRSHLSGQGVTIDVIVAVDSHLSTAASHDIADEIERTLRESFATPDVTVHVEPED